MDYDTEKAQALYRDGQTYDEWLDEAVDQYAAAYGAEAPDRAWILSPLDTWEPNPFYKGPPVPHPEDDEAWREEGG